MKKLYWFIKLITAGVALFCLVNWQFPSLTNGIVNDANAAIRWTGAEYNSIKGQISPTSSPKVATPLKLVLGPAPQLSAVVAPATFPAAPVTVQMGGTAAAWSAADCSTTLNNMNWDAGLDASTAAQDYKSDPGLSTYYNQWSNNWATVAHDIEIGPCAKPARPLTPSACTDPQEWFQTAIAGHKYDEQQHSQNTAWDDQWVKIYEQAAALWATTEGCAS